MQYSRVLYDIVLYTVIYQCLFGSKNDDGVGYLNERISRWIVFPWERSDGGM